MMSRHLLQQSIPWLINALAYEICFEMEEGRDRNRMIDKEMVDQAKENLIVRRETHLDQLADKLQEAESDQPTWTRWQGLIQKAVIECKLLHKSLEQTIEAGLEQTWAYMDGCGTEEGHLVVFDRREGISWKEKIFKRQESFQGMKIVVWGM